MRIIECGIISLALLGLLTGCDSERIYVTKGEDTWFPKNVGMPYYLPKPYLIVSRNVRYIPTLTVGLTQTAAIPSSFDSGGGGGQGGNSDSSKQQGGQQSQQGQGQQQDATKGSQGSGGGGAANNNNNNLPGVSISYVQGDSTQNPTTGPKTDPNSTPKTNDNSNASNANESQYFGPASLQVVPSASIPDGLVPQEFYTYQIVYLPDIASKPKYHLHVKGGPGEWRATLNLVNGWMFTGPGPLYMRDSNTAETISAVGQAFGSVAQGLGLGGMSTTGAPTTAPSTKGGKGSVTVAPGGAISAITPPKSAWLPSDQNPPTIIPHFAQVRVFEIVSQSDAEDGKKNMVLQELNVKGSPAPIDFDRYWVSTSPNSHELDASAENMAKEIAPEFYKALGDAGGDKAGLTSLTVSLLDSGSSEMFIEVEMPRSTVDKLVSNKKGVRTEDASKEVLSEQEAKLQEIGKKHSTAELIRTHVVIAHTIP